SSSFSASADAMCFEERAMSVPEVSSTVTIDRLDSELEEVVSTFSRPRTEFSTGVEMRSLTCSVEDPGEVVTTWICGSVTDGMSSWRKVDIDITPRIATAMHTNAMKARLDRLRAARRCIVLLGVRACRGGAGHRASPRRRSSGRSPRLVPRRELSHANLRADVRPPSVLGRASGEMRPTRRGDEEEAGGTVEVVPAPDSARRTVDRDILRLAVPSLGALIAEPLFLMTDSAFIARVSTVSLAGLGLASAVLTTVIGLSVFLAYSTTASVARAFGAGRRQEAIARGVDACWLALMIGVGAAALLAVGGRFLLSLFGPSAEVLDQATIYLMLSAAGVPAMLAVQAATGL